MLVSLLLGIATAIPTFPGSSGTSGVSIEHPPIITTGTSSALSKHLNFPYGKVKTRGVNLGGWLVLEPWIKPSLFEAFTGYDKVPIDERTYCQYLGKDAALKRLTEHWETWYQESDIKGFADAGINHLRIPIGYWAYDIQPDEPWVSGQDAYLEKAIVWAEKYGLKVWIDLHGVPGSQNGFDNSGKVTEWTPNPVDGSPQGVVGWNTLKNKVRSLAVLRQIKLKYARNPTVGAIQLINEPNGYRIPVEDVQKYYKDAYAFMKSESQLTILHDMFHPLEDTYDVFQYPTFRKIGLDTHIYQVFSEEQVHRDHGTHLMLACEYRLPLAQSKQKIPTFVGEWSAAETDCAYWLNGVGQGARYDGTYPGITTPVGACGEKGDKGLQMNSLARMSPDQIRETTEYVAAQLHAYEYADGWFFWAGKTETADLWNFQKLVEYNVFPQPLADQSGLGVNTLSNWCQPYPLCNSCEPNSVIPPGVDPAIISSGPSGGTSGLSE